MHRDIKPANLWLEAETHRVKILDFGLARAAGDDSHLTQQGAIVGTPAYMAPEQARGEEIDARCDLFSLGCVLYRMCTGELPFKGDDTISILSALALETPPAPAAVNPQLPGGLSDRSDCFWRSQRSSQSSQPRQGLSPQLRPAGRAQYAAAHDLPG